VSWYPSFVPIAVLFGAAPLECTRQTGYAIVVRFNHNEAAKQRTADGH
jgi:hypothetical protein